jgi:hydroxymethylpyrimidine pyrophosphatase-like HAD family hydrolase
MRRIVEPTVSYFRAIAIDYDGTLTLQDRPNGDVLAALQRLRRRGWKLILVTGRILSELRQVFPDVEDWFDAVVAENGAVLRVHGITRVVTAPVPFGIDGPLIEQGVSFFRGQVLLACSSEHELAVLKELRRLGADCHLVRNRQALMVLPADVSKGSGLFKVLGELGVSYHSTIGIGDAENDISLLQQCELGLAVGNAVPSLKEIADVVLPHQNGTALIELIDGPLQRGERLVEPRRWQVELGRSPNDEPVRLPGSGFNLLVTGESGVGKSYAAGLFSEQLIERGYSLCIIDPEGDHAPLGRLHGAMLVGGLEALPGASQIPELLQKRFASVVIDLSLTEEVAQAAFLAELFMRLTEERGRSGLPHWIVVDEAQESLGGRTVLAERLASGAKGFCLITYDLGQLGDLARSGIDFVLAVAGSDGLSEATVAALSNFCKVDGGFPRIGRGQGLLMRPGSDAPAEVVDFGARMLKHVRHWHKYTQAHLPPDRTFRFRTVFGLTGAVASNIEELRRELLRCDRGVIEHHAPHHDFSSWLKDSIQDEDLARALHEIEEQHEKGASPERLRRELVEAIEARYLG